MVRSTTISTRAAESMTTWQAGAGHTWSNGQGDAAGQASRLGQGATLSTRAAESMVNWQGGVKIGNQRHQSRAGKQAGAE